MTTEDKELKDQKNGTGDDGLSDEDKMPEPEISAEAIDRVDMSLDDILLDEILAQEMLLLIQAYHSEKNQLKALRHNKKDADADKVWIHMQTVQSQVALIQSEHPGTVAIYKQLAVVAGKARAKARENSLGDKD